MFYKILYLGFKIYCFLFRPIRMGVRVVLIQDGKVRLVRHTYLEGWFLPGGGIKKNETLEQAARREAFEETGARMENLRLLGVFSNFEQWKTDHTSIFLCDAYTISGTPDGEIAEMRLFPLKRLPKKMNSIHRNLLKKYASNQITAPFGEW